MFVDESVCAFVGSLLPTSQLKIGPILHVIRCSLLPVLSRHIGHLVGAGLFPFLSPCSPVIFRKVSEVFPLTPSGYEIAAKQWDGDTFTPPINTKVNEKNETLSRYQNDGRQGESHCCV